MLTQTLQPLRKRFLALSADLFRLTLEVVARPCPERATKLLTRASNPTPIRINFPPPAMRKRAPRLSARNKSHRPLTSIQLLPLTGLPEIHQGNDLAPRDLRNGRKVAHRLRKRRHPGSRPKSCLQSRRPPYVTHRNNSVARAADLAAKLKKDPRLIEVILRESRRIVRSDPVLIVETHHGFVCANAGVDQSNIPGDDVVSLLPRDPDATARRLAAALRKLTRKRIAVIISDTFGRPWRLGLTNVAIGAAGVPALLDLRGTRDLHGKPLHATILAVADELAAAAGLLMAKSGGIPAVIIRGYRYRPVLDPAARIIRPANEDLFR